ncbi:hypothetical protein VFPFJ_07278 [Purpureocillium lilacinum]|uniref:Uncharacterized protein n=1 Tax=Purpureocillium lilacinum TaxID=33203 RepID=A0A179HH58_PURLI|nr:hypothetical protein VFPFJ_07278 [Purpureocillium lilacinum]OAQ88813.1 hypothetical protein VFPFJ_07278 [Purpureocillium lilacinum]
MRPIHTLLALVGTDAVTAWVFPAGLEDGDCATDAAPPPLLPVLLVLVRPGTPAAAVAAAPNTTLAAEGQRQGQGDAVPVHKHDDDGGGRADSADDNDNYNVIIHSGDGDGDDDNVDRRHFLAAHHDNNNYDAIAIALSRNNVVILPDNNNDENDDYYSPPGHPDNHHDEDPYDPYDDDDLVIHPHEEPTYYRDVPYFGTPRNASKRLHLAQVPVRVTDFSCVRTRLPLPHDEVEEGFLSLRWFCARYLLSPRTMHLSVSRNGSTAAFVCNMAYPMGTNLDAVCPKDKRQSCRFDKEGRPVSFDVTRPKRNRWQDEPEAPPGVVFGAQMCSGKEFRDVQKRWLDKYCGLDVPGQVFVKGKNKWYGRAFRGMEICPDQKVDVFDRIPRWTGWPYWYEPPPALFREIWEPSPEADGNEHDRRPSA